MYRCMYICCITYTIVYAKEDAKSYAKGDAKGNTYNPDVIGELNVADNQLGSAVVYRMYKVKKCNIQEGKIQSWTRC